jgi:hypothetical protein
MEWRINGVEIEEKRRGGRERGEKRREEKRRVRGMRDLVGGKRGKGSEKVKSGSLKFR